MIEWLSTKMEWQYAFQPFHLFFLIGIVIFGALLLIFFRKCNDKTFRLIVGIAWGVIMILEVGKELVWGYSNGTGKFIYDWYSFPYQFCSLPFYVWPFVFLLPKSKFKDSLNIFVGTYMFFAGFAYLFIASSMCDYVLINIQTLVHHGLQATIGLFIFVHERDNFTFKKFLLSIPFLVVTVALAVILNVVIVKAGHGTNLFELNPMPGYQTSAAVFGDILAATNYPTYLLTYLIGFTAFAAIFYWIFIGFIELNRKLLKKSK